jgi:hypothetical protein
MLHQSQQPHPFTRQLPLLPPSGQHHESDHRLAETTHHIGLVGAEAMRTSAEHWPDRIDASPDPAGYLHWHRQVCPGGSAHERSIGPYLTVRGSSVKEAAHALIAQMDHFHGQVVFGPASPIILPSSQQGDAFTSLEVFFAQLRVYSM